jgi:hypothetical protein
MSGKAILVTGSHRSGSTWVGKVISESPSVAYIHEPFNIHAQPSLGVCSAKFDYWFTYISSENESKYYRDFQNVLEWKYNLLPAILQTRSRQELKKVIKEYEQFLKYRNSQTRPLLKDPLAIFSTEWMASRFNLDVVILIRHPAAFAGSLKVKNWRFPFAHFLQQPLLMQNYLYPFKDEIKAHVEKERDIIDQAALLWKIFHHIIANYQEKHPDWLFVRHEDISFDPAIGFQKVFEHLNLDFSEAVQQKVQEYSNLEKSKSANQKVPTWKRDSRSNIWEWQARLDLSEIERLRTQIEDVSSKFYTDADWKIPDRLNLLAL